MRSFLVVLALLSACGAGQDISLSREVKVHQIPTPSPEDQVQLSNCLLSLNTSNRHSQKEALMRIQSHGIKALPALLSGLEVGSAQTREGCREALVELSSGNAILKEGRISHREIIEGWILYEMSRGYEDLPETVSLGERRIDPLVSRSTYRQYLCMVFEKIGTPEGAMSLFESTRSDRNELVRCAAYQAVARRGAKNLVPALVGRYRSEEGQAREALWNALRLLSGKNYPDNPGVWEHWLSEEGG